jgi:hypothetical protein
MKKSLILFVLVVVLGIIAWQISKNRPADSTSYNVSASEFAVENIQSIQRIFIVDKSGMKIDLKKGRNEWIVNDVFRADQNSVDLLLKGIQKLEIQYIPPKAANENIIKTMASFGIQVEIFGKGNALLKKYFIGGMTQDERGTYFLMDGANQPYVMQVPGFVGNLRERYRPEIKRFRSQRFLTIDPSRLKQIDVRYPKLPENDFRLVSTLTGYELSLGSTGEFSQSQKAVKGRVEAFLDGLQKVACESYLTGDVRQDSVSAETPFCVMRIEQDKEDIQNVQFWQKQTSQNASQQGLHRFYMLKDGEFMLGQYDVIKEAFRNGAYFLK